MKLGFTNVGAERVGADEAQPEGLVAESLSVKAFKSITQISVSSLLCAQFTESCFLFSVTEHHLLV